MSDQQVYVIQHYERREFESWEYDVFTKEELEAMRKPEHFGWHKIGISNDVQSRLSALRGGTPFSLRLITTIGVEGGAKQVERELHDLFGNPWNDHGEWFRLPKKTLYQLKDVEVLHPGEVAQIRDLASHAGDLSVPQPGEIDLIEALEDIRSGRVRAELERSP